MKLDTRDVGGSSAGLMLALAVYNSLTPGDLTAGQRVAGTGALSADGRVHPVGGVAFKVRAAQKAGATRFLVPRANSEEARAGAQRLHVVEVDHFGDAVAYLTNLASSIGHDRNNVLASPASAQ